MHIPKLILAEKLYNLHLDIGDWMPEEIDQNFVK
jgi:hypothetical protein